MFTGLIEDIGKVITVHSRRNYKILQIESKLADDELQVGDSVACDGACLTVVSMQKGNFTVEASQETVRKTILSSYHPGTRINLERALQAGKRLGGHFVMGHVDDTGIIDSIKQTGDSIEIGITFDNTYDNLVISKGSIAINGISLTINNQRSGWLSVNVIPHTQTATTISRWKSGDGVNLEFDMIGKYILNIHAGSEKKGLTKRKLIESGW